MKQITIVTKDRDGLAADIAAVLGENDINIDPTSTLSFHRVITHEKCVTSGASTDHPCDRSPIPRTQCVVVT